MSRSESPWSKQTRDNWFFGFLALATFALGYLFLPYLYVLLFAAVVVVVTWPIHLRIRVFCGGRIALSSLLTTGFLALLIFGPLSFIAYMFLNEVATVIDPLRAQLAKGALVQDWMSWAWSLNDPRLTRAVEAVTARLPADFNLIDTVAGPLQSAALSALNGMTDLLPALIQTGGAFALDGVIFIFAVLTLYMEGPKVLQVGMNLSPMDDLYEARLFSVFREFASNMVVGTLATSAIQGVVAAIGYAIAGVPNVILLGILTAVFSFVPMVGTALIWIPATLWTGATHGWGWALFVALYSLLVTGLVDNALKPLFLRGKTDIHPLLIFLAVFGGLSWMGLPGVLVGPVFVAFFLALYTIYLEDYLGEVPQIETPKEPGRFGRLLARMRDLASGRAVRSAAAGASAAELGSKMDAEIEQVEPDPMDQ